MNNNSIWTQQLIAEITELWKTQSARAIAEIINQRHGLALTRCSVIGKLHRLGLSVENKTEVHPLTRANPGIPASRRNRNLTPILKIIPGFKSLRIIKTTFREAEPLRCVPLEPKHISLNDIEHGECLFPFGDGPFTFCGHTTRDGSNYCASHHFLCRVQTERQREGRVA